MEAPHVAWVRPRGFKGQGEECGPILPLSLSVGTQSKHGVQEHEDASERL